MGLLNESTRQWLIENHNTNQERSEQGLREIDFVPPAKFFTPGGSWTWLLTELNPDTNVAFGLCDLGMGFPELGYVSLDELTEVRDELGLPIEQDNSFGGTMPISWYAEEARKHGEIRA